MDTSQDGGNRSSRIRIPWFKAGPTGTNSVSEPAVGSGEGANTGPQGDERWRNYDLSKSCTTGRYVDGDPDDPALHSH